MNKVLPSLFKFLEYSPVILAAVLPLLFMPLTTEYFETAKVAFLFLASSLLFVIWSLKMVSEKKVSFVRSKLDLPLVLMAVVYTLATLLAPNKYTAIFGSYLRFQPGLLFTLALIVLYYTLSANLRSKEIRRWAVTTFVLGVGLSCALALANFLGAFEILPLPATLAFLKGRTFNTTGSLTTLSVLAGLAFTLALGLLSELHESHKTHEAHETYLNYLLRGALFTTLAVVVFYAILPGWVALIVGLTATMIFEPSIVTKQKTLLVPLAVWASLLFLVIMTPALGKGFNLSRPAEVNLSLSDSWAIASQTLTNAPLVGPGLGQFPYLFTLFKPLNFNTSPFWNLRFDRPFNELILILAETGLIGLGVTLFFLAKVLGLSLSGKNKEGFMVAVRAALMALVAVYLVTNNSVLLASTLTILLAVFVASQEEEGAKLSERVVVMVSAIRDRLFGLVGSTRRVGKIPDLTDKDPGSSSRTATQILPYFLLLISVSVAVFVGLAVFFGYGAEYYNRLSLAAVARNDGRGAYNNLVLAISYNPNLDFYQRNLASLSLAIAANISARPNVTDSDRQTVANLIQEAIRRGRIVSEIIEPASVANWETRAQIYQNLIGVAQNAEQWTVDSYARAISLDPTNPNLRILLGAIYFGLKNYDLAAQSFGQAASLKSDLANAHYNLAQALIQLNRKADALGQYGIVLNLIGGSSPDYKRTSQERDGLAKQVQTEAAAPAQTSSTPLGAGSSQQEKLTVPPPTTNIKKQNVTPLNLGKVNEASPAATQ